MRVRDTKSFIEKAIKIHGDKYDYSVVEYKSAKEKIKIICKIHGIFEKSPDEHLSKHQGCQVCARLSVSEKNSSNTEEFKEKIRLVHKDLYDLSEVDYVNNISKILVTCREHGKFTISPNKFLGGGGCQKCSKRHSGDLPEFIENAIKKHGNKYSYTSVNYKNKTTKVAIECGSHGKFYQTPSNHLLGKGCPKCGDELIAEKNRSTTEEFVLKAREVHGEAYSYSKTSYTKVHAPLTITCNKCGKDFEQIAASHLRGSGCAQCKTAAWLSAYRLSQEEFLTRVIEVHGNRYDLSKAVYGRNNEQKVTILCPTHGEFSIRPSVLMIGGGCSACASTGFNSISEATLYVLTSSDMVKVGITRSDRADKRIRQIKNDSGINFNLVKSYYFNSGQKAFTLEQTLLKYLRTTSTQTELRFGGYTECFYGVNLPHLINMIEENINAFD